MSGDYDNTVDVHQRDEFLHQSGIWDAALTQDQLTERYLKFKDVDFGLAPREVHPQLY